MYTILASNSLRRWTYIAAYSTTKYLCFDNSSLPDQIVDIGTIVAAAGGFYSIGKTVKWRNSINNNYDKQTIYWMAIE